MQGRNLGEIFKMHWFANILRYAVSRAKLRRGIWFICTKFCRWKVTRLNLGQGCHLEVPMEITEGLHCNYRVMAWQCLILNIKQYAYMYLQIIEMCQFFVTFWDISPRSNVDTIPVWDCPQDAGFVWGRYYTPFTPRCNTGHHSGTITSIKVIPSCSNPSTLFFSRIFSGAGLEILFFVLHLRMLPRKPVSSWRAVWFGSGTECSHDG